MAWCTDNRYEFSSLRRATFSTMHMLHNLHLNNNTSDQEDSTRANVEQCIESLNHACICNDAHCEYISCVAMKNILRHTKECNEISAGTCIKCNKFMAIICYHSKRCTATKCPMPFCLIIRLKRSEQILSLQLREIQRRVTATIICKTH